MAGLIFNYREKYEKEKGRRRMLLKGMLQK